MHRTRRSQALPDRGRSGCRARPARRQRQAPPGQEGHRSALRHCRRHRAPGAVSAASGSTRDRLFSTTRSSVVVADFENRTNDPAFDRVLEPMLKIRALEGAGFITAYDRNGIRRNLGVQPPEQFGEVAARELAVKQGLGVVLSASSSRRGGVTESRCKATQAVTGDVITTAQGTASSNDQVLEASTRLMTRVRNGTRRRRVGVGADVRDDQSLGDLARCRTSLRDGTRGGVEQQVRGSTGQPAEGGRARPAFRHRLSEPGRCVAEPREAAGSADLHQGRTPLHRRHDRARALQHARDVLAAHRRLPAVRQGIRRADFSIRRRRSRA